MCVCYTTGFYTEALYLQEAQVCTIDRLRGFQGSVASPPGHAFPGSQGPDRVSAYSDKKDAVDMLYSMKAVRQVRTVSGWC